MSYYDTSYPPSLWEPPAPIPATGVIPGSPGSFTPVGCETPADLATLQGMGALGETTAWTTGQYVVLGDASNANWNGTGWVAGIHADEPQAQTQSEPEAETYTAIPVDELPPDIEGS